MKKILETPEIIFIADKAPEKTESTGANSIAETLCDDRWD